MEFVLASNNRHKMQELQQILAPYRITLRPAPAGFDVDETGATFAENARLKAEAAMRMTGLPAIADDSGLVIDALGGEPGIYSARYGGADCKTDRDRWSLVLEKMKRVEPDARTARFVCTICCAYPDGRRITATGRCEGTIAFAPQGTDGFGYDPIFYLPTEGMTFAQLSAERKNELSHRGAAIAAFCAALDKEVRDADK